jgi:hypothetical protein
VLAVGRVQLLFWEALELGGEFAAGGGQHSSKLLLGISKFGGIALLERCFYGLGGIVVSVDWAYENDE